jgi:hypothetical protein
VKTIRIRVDEMDAGDRIVVKEGSIRKTYTICEFGWEGNIFHYVYIKNGRFHKVENVPGNRKVTVRDD